MREEETALTSEPARGGEGRRETGSLTDPRAAAAATSHTDNMEAWRHSGGGCASLIVLRLSSDDILGWRSSVAAGGGLYGRTTGGR